jgi:tripartite-type tricarboxylate transporter receptor subunit TctC
MLSRRHVLLGLAAGGLNRAHANETFPNRSIKIVVPFPPGAPSEVVVRAVAERMSSRFGQPVVIENRPGGAGGTVGAASAAKAEPDGYTLLASPPGPLVTATALYKGLGYNPADFVPVALLFESPQFLTANPALPVRSPQELVAFAKANPGKIAFASPGYGTQPHLLGEMLKAAAGIDIVHVPYKGPANAITDLIAGQVQIYFETSPLVLPQAQSGRLKVLAAASARRVPQLPDVPTTAESGFPELRGGFWSGIVAPPRTPAAIVSVLNAAINAAMQADGVKGALLKLGAESRLGSPGDFRSFLAEESRKWTAIIKTAGLKID